MRLCQHQILLLQQLQPLPAPLLLQGLPPLLDQRRLPPQRPRRRRLPQEPPLLKILPLRSPPRNSRGGAGNPQDGGGGIGYRYGRRFRQVLEPRFGGGRELRDGDERRAGWVSVPAGGGGGIVRVLRSFPGRRVSGGGGSAAGVADIVERRDGATGGGYVVVDGGERSRSGDGGMGNAAAAGAGV
ncbi:unnamed protein product [Linum tenue]|uniref:Uncharacterized protein n=1 Tax=Linum tenue TaxID=586396 RepID=A0AAV0IEK1_9ROSI|nr:unnamed protein product [Linum tenue]